MTRHSFRLFDDVITRTAGNGLLRRGKHQFVFVAVLAALVAAGAPLPVAGTGTAEAAQAKASVETTRLVGQWLRPDGGYVLELGEVKKDGTLKASYYNPRPINVARSEVRRTKDGMIIYVELRDVNYPGSNYNLRYDRVSDRLKGTYFQAIEKATYEVEFVRLQ